MDYKFYVMSKINNHVIGIISETETTITVQKLKIGKTINSISFEEVDTIVPDESHAQVNNATIPKDDLSFRFDEVEITKDYWRVFEYLTGRKMNAIAQTS